VAVYFTDDAVYEWTPAPAPFKGKAEIRAFFEDVFKGFPDFGTTEGRVFATTNIVVVEHSTTGTHRGLWQGIPPTGKSAPMPHLDVYDYAGNKIKHATTYADAGGVMIQLGVLPAPAMPVLVPSFKPPEAQPTGLASVAAAVEAVSRWNTHDLVHYAKMVRSDATFFIAPFGVPLDRNGWLAASELYFLGFSDVRLDITRKVDLGEGWVLAEGVAHGTHDGLFLGVPATGAAASVKAGLLFRIDAEGRLQLMNDYYDNLTLLAQITAPEWPIEGTWMAAIPTPLGNMIVKCTYVAQDIAKTRFTPIIEQINQVPVLIDLYPGMEYVKFAGGQVAKD